MPKAILVTGGAGFIGSHLVKHFVLAYPECQIVNFDKLTYCGYRKNVRELEQKENYLFCQGDIRDSEFVQSLFQRFDFDGVIHLAAESHVDRSISSPTEFVETNVLGTTTLLDSARKHWTSPENRCFLHVSTDEVFGSLGHEGAFTESSPYDPQSPYAASKAAADHLVRAYHNTYKLPVKISNCSNNYGSHQFPEKLIPVCISRIQNNEPIPVYGKGLNVRDWLYVEDHVEALDLIFHKGVAGESYNIGGGAEMSNINLVEVLCDLTDQKLGRPLGSARELITFVKDRAGHDFRYAIDAGKIKRELGWEPRVTFAEGLAETIDWYLEHQDWFADKQGAKV